MFLFRKRFSGFDEWDLLFEYQVIDDGEGNLQQYEMLLEFYLFEIEKGFEWRVIFNVVIEVILIDS